MEGQKKDAVMRVIARLASANSSDKRAQLSSSRAGDNLPNALPRRETLVIVIVSVEDERRVVPGQHSPKHGGPTAWIAPLEAVNAGAESRVMPVSEDAWLAVRGEIAAQPGHLIRRRAHVDHAV